MVLMMYWENESEEQRKLEREEKLRAKKGLPPPPIELLPDANNQDLAGVIDKQAKLAEDQNQKLDQLTRVIAKQQRMLQEIVNSNGHVTQHTDKKIEPEEETTKFTKLEDADINVVDTIGIEMVGEAGSVTEGENILDRVAKLKKMKRDKGDQNG
jgi:hypothetical protein